MARPVRCRALAGGSYLLYYAGMAADNVTEQIGVAVSEDGTAFRRARETPAIPVAAGTQWKSLRTCNPTVLRRRDGYAMWYLGIAQAKNISAARALSEDGIEWACDPEPCLPWEQLREADPGRDDVTRIGVSELSVLEEAGRLRMWFAYMSSTYPGFALLHAESRDDGRSWEVRPEPLLEGAAFGHQLRFHYPQVVPAAHGYDLLFTLRDMVTYVDGCFRMRSADGFRWTGLEQLLPWFPNGIRLERRKLVDVDPVPGAASHGLRRLVWAANWRAAALVHRGRNVLGYAHPHVLDASDPRIYVHNCHLKGRDRRHDIALGELRDGRITRLRTVFERGGPGAWDEFFVADPFVVRVS